MGLPVTLPALEEDALPPCHTWECVYTERLHGGWHIYDGKPVAFPFGHGLSFTNFEYSVERIWFPLPGVTGFQSVIRVKNIGYHAGNEVIQLYVDFPHHEADE